MTFAAITTLPKTTHNISTFDTAKHRQITPKKSRFLHTHSRMETFLHSHSRFIQNPGYKPAVEKET